MKKLLTLLMILTLAIPAWAGEQTITISRNDGQFENSSGVYYASKGGVTMTMSGGMNNPNYLVCMHYKRITFQSANYKIKKIVFHCMDNYTNSQQYIDKFYWGPTTMDVVYNTDLGTIPGKYHAPHEGNTFDGCWESSYSGSLSGHTSYSGGFPVGQLLHFEATGKPIRFASIDIVIDKENGDIYDLVTSNDEIQENQTYVLVSQYASKALSTKLKQGPSFSNNAYTTETFASTPVTLLDNNQKVKVTSDVQLITLVHPQWYENRPWLLKVGNSYLRRRNGTDHLYTNSNNRGWNLYKVNEIPTDQNDINWYYYRVSISVTGNINNNALIKFYHNESGQSDYDYAIRHYNGGGYFRDIDYSSNNTDAANQRVYLYKPSQSYEVTTAVKPSDDDGAISLRDGIIVTNGKNMSQKFETVQFLVTPAEGKKIASVTIAYDDDETTTITPLSISPSINGTLYSFEMPGHNVHITATFEDVTYRDIKIEVKPFEKCGNVYITQGYAVQNDQVVSYDGQNVVFNVVSNPSNIDEYPNNPENWQYYDLISVTVTDDVTGESITYNLSDGNYSFIMPDHNVTITANFRAKLMISTACEPDNGGYFEQSTMTCNGQGTNFYNGAQYYVGDYMTFMVKTNYGYSINKVVLTDGDGTETILSPTDIYNDGNFYGFTMPNSNVTITAYFYQSVSDLYLLGTHNGNTAWHSYGPKFEYDADTQTYSIEVYYKGVDTDYGQGTSNDGDKYGYFSFTESVNGDINGDNWNIGPRYGSSSKNNDDVLGSYENPSNTATAGLTGGENCFKVPAGVYRIEVNKEKTQTTITRLDVGLTFSPVGGNDEQSAPITSYGTQVTMASAIQNMVHNIADDYAADYPNYIANGFEEVDMSMTYSLAETTDLNTIKQSGTPTVANPTFTLLDYDIADGEPVVKVDGDAWLGWIHADNTAYYKVINTPLKWIEEKGTEGHKYIVSDELIIVHKIDREGQRLLWAKDQSSSATDPYNNPTNKNATFKTANQTDYLDETYHAQAQGWDGWDQSNWVMLRFPEGTNMNKYQVNQFIDAGTIKGCYVDDVNYCIDVEEEMDVNSGAYYLPNTFCTANFLDYNLNLNNTEGGAVSPSGKKFFFMNPKVQEVADVTLAVWDKTNSRFVMPSGDGVNQAGIVGYFTINCLYNSDGDITNNLVNGTMYSFRGVLNVAPGGSNASKDAPTAPDATKMVMPFDLNDQSVVTAINDVDANKTVSSVKYYNITGIESDKPFNGVNIVVTRYTDGSFSTTKVLR